MSALDAIRGPGFAALFHAATRLPDESCECRLCGELFPANGEPDCAECIAYFDDVADVDRPPADRVAWCDPIPDMEPSA